MESGETAMPSAIHSAIPGAGAMLKRDFKNFMKLFSRNSKIPGKY
jgi:hypothetical protein